MGCVNFTIENVPRWGHDCQDEWTVKAECFPQCLTHSESLVVIVLGISENVLLAAAAH